MGLFCLTRDLQSKLRLRRSFGSRVRFGLLAKAIINDGLLLRWLRWWELKIVTALGNNTILFTLLVVVALVNIIIFVVLARWLRLFRDGFYGSLILFTELLARFLVLFVFELNLDVANDNSLDFFASLPILFWQTGAAITLRPYFLGEGGLGVASIELVSVGRSMHHELLGLKVVGLSDKVCNDVRMLGQ